MTTVNVTPRAQPIPVRLEEQPYAISVFVGSVKVAAAWGPAVDDGRWFIAKPGAAPRRVDSRDWALTILEEVADECRHREGSVWRSGDPDPGDGNYIREVPDGVVCMGCGTSLNGGGGFILTEEFMGARRRHFLCDPCECYLDDEGDDDA